MFLTPKLTNVSEIGLGSGMIYSREERAISASAAPAVEELRKAIRGSRVTGFTVGHRQEGSSVSVRGKFTVELGGETLKFTVHLIKDGVWEPGPFGTLLSIAKLQGIDKVVESIVEEASRFSSLEGQPGERSQPKLLVKEHLARVMKPDMEEADERIRSQTAAILSLSDTKAAAHECWTNAVRHLVHKALLVADGISVDLMHRLVDEFYVKEVHDS